LYIPAPPPPRAAAAMFNLATEVADIMTVCIGIGADERSSLTMIATRTAPCLRGSKMSEGEHIKSLKGRKMQFKDQGLIKSKNASNC
jgi:hypothetical protein